MGMIWSPGGGGSKSPLTTKGDVWGFSTLDARVPVGTDGQVLTAHSAAALGVDWETAAVSANNNEALASTLINATSPGDAGGRADHFTGTSLGAKWTVEESAALSQVVANSSLAVSSAGTTTYSETYTPSGNFTVEARIFTTGISPGPTTASAGLMVHDSTATSGGEGILCQFETGGGQLNTNFYTQDAGTFNSRANNQMAPGSGFPTPVWLYIRINRTGTLFTCYWSVDRANWMVVGAGGFNKTLTVAKLCWRCSTGNHSNIYNGIDFIDVAA